VVAGFNIGVAERAMIFNSWFTKKTKFLVAPSLSHYQLPITN
jgi:hypothetical protein